MRDHSPATKGDQEHTTTGKARSSTGLVSVDAAPETAAPAAAPSGPILRRADLLALQRTVGNRSVQRLMLARTPALHAPEAEEQAADVSGPETGLEAEPAGDASESHEGPPPSIARLADAHDHTHDDHDHQEAGEEAEAEEGILAAGPDGQLQRKSDPAAGPPDVRFQGVIQRAGRAKAIWEGIKSGAKTVGGGIVKGGKAVGEGIVKGGKAIGEGVVKGGKAIGRGAKTAGEGIVKGAKAAGKGIAKGAEYATTVGIKDGTGVQNKAGKMAGNIAEGLFNAMVGPVSPRWWYKAVSDIKGIKKSDYGTGASARVFQVLGITSQVVQKIGTTAGVLSLALGIAGAVLGSLMGAGAACALGSAVCGLIAFIASCTAFILQSVLVFGNLIKQGWTAIKGDAAKKKRFFGDIASMIGSAIGVVGGGLGVNWGAGAGLFDSGSKSVLEGATAGIANSGNLVNGQVVGASTQGALVGQQFANFSMGQMFGSSSDTVSEGVGVFAKHDPSMVQRAPVIQREGESEGGEGESQDPEELKSAVRAFMSSARESQDQDDEVADDMKSSLDAVDNVFGEMSKPLSSAGVKAPPGAPTEMPVASGAESMPGKLDEAKQSLDTIESDTNKTGKYNKKDQAKLEQADIQVQQAEEKLGVSGEPAKKPSLFKRMKDWVVNKVLNLKTRIKKLAAAAKAKLISVAMDVMGVKEQFEELKDTASQDRESNVDTIQEAAESSEAAESAEEKAEEFESSIGKG